MYYTGLDVHDEYTNIQHMDAQGFLGITDRIATTPSSLRDIFDQLDSKTNVCLEAGRNWWWISQCLEKHPKVDQVKILDPRRSRRIAEELSVISGYGRAKTDRIDAEMMAEEDRRGIAPAIRIPTPHQLEKRTLVRYRYHLLQHKTMVCNRLQGLLAFHGIRINNRALIAKFDSYQRQLEVLNRSLRFIIGEWINQIRLYSKQLKRCERHLSKLLPESDQQIKILMSVPGIGIVISRIILTKLFSIKDFKHPKYVISYAGLAPIVNESSNRFGIMKLNRYCNYYLKYAFIMAAHSARTHIRYRKKYTHDIKTHGKIRAKINLARRIAKAVYWMLIRQQPFS
jgi:transposase